MIVLFKTVFVQYVAVAITAKSVDNYLFDMWITLWYDGYMTCTKYGCNYELDLDGQVTCTVCGAMDDDIQPVNIDVIE